MLHWQDILLNMRFILARINNALVRLIEHSDPNLDEDTTSIT